MLHNIMLNKYRIILLTIHQYLLYDTTYTSVTVFLRSIITAVADVDSKEFRTRTLTQ